MKEITRKVIARKIADMAACTVENTVGKSVPLLIHEVKMPDSIRKQKEEICKIK